VAFAGTGFKVDTPAALTPEVAAAFVQAPLADGGAPSVSLLHLRRSALRLFFRSLRHAGVSVGDPTLDLVLPPRSQLAARPLSDDEVTLCRGHALWSLVDARRAAAWALAEATCRSVEVAHIRVGDVDLDGRRVWIHGGRTTAPRWGQLTEWGVTHLKRRVQMLPDEPDTPVVYGGSGDATTGQVSACVAIADVLTRAGLAAEPDVRPASVAAWAGQKILEETGRIDEVARRLGMASLDRTARFIAFDWSDDR
jgi:integrase/recombinase XerC